MIHKLTDQVWFGNWSAPFECIGQVGSIINVAHNFSERRGRHVYWQRLREIPHTTMYFRLARKDRENVDDKYLFQLECILDAVENAGKLPLLTHCQLGGHRGPTSAIMSAWYLGNLKRELLVELQERALTLVPGLARGRNYYQSAMRLMMEQSV